MAKSEATFYDQAHYGQAHRDNHKVYFKMTLVRFAGADKKLGRHFVVTGQRLGGC